MLEFSKQVAHVCLSNGLDTATVEHMVKSGAVISHERGNRRYHAWLFEVQGNKVSRMSWIKDLREVNRKGQSLTVIEECPECEGPGCNYCGWAGEVKVVYS